MGVKGGGTVPPLPLPYGLFCWGLSEAVVREIRQAMV